MQIKGFVSFPSYREVISDVYTIIIVASHTHPVASHTQALFAESGYETTSTTSTTIIVLTRLDKCTCTDTALYPRSWPSKARRAQSGK